MSVWRAALWCFYRILKACIFLKRLLTKPCAKLQELAAPYVQEGCGFIIRTAAAKASADEIGRDMDYLWRTWQHVLKRFKVAKSGTDLYSDADFWFRLVRDYAHRNVEEIIVDSDMGESSIAGPLRAWTYVTTN